MSCGNLYGLFIGVDRYESGDIRPLAFASADVLAVRDKLAERWGLQCENTVVLVDDAEGCASPTRRQMLRAMDRFAAAPMEGSDLFVFMFAGHGFSCDGRTFLAVHDSEIASEALLRETAVSLETVRNFLGQIPAGQQLIVLDACRDSPVRGTRGAGASSMSDEMTRDISTVIRAGRGQSPAEQRASAVLCSCWEGQVAHEYAEGGHGWFCHNLLAELDAAERHQLLLSELHQRIKARMRESAWRLLPAAKDQTPHLLIEGDVPVLRLAGQLAFLATEAANAKPPQEVALSCALCGNALSGDPFRCTHCGQVCCRDCTDPSESMCMRCAQKLAVQAESRARLPKPSTVMHSAGFVQVPAGLFLMGRNLRECTVAEFGIALALTTCGQYAAFLKQTGYRPEGQVKRLLDRRPADHPVGNVTFNDACVFAEWAGCRLPAEEEWEKAARGSNGRVFPWGNTFVVAVCNSADAGVENTLPAISLPEGRSPHGCYHMSGNVWEWTDSWYDTPGNERVVRGGSYLEDARQCKCFYREGMDPRYSKPDLGFRCVRTTHTR